MKNVALGERIRRARKMLGLTQQHFADQLGVTQPTVHRWEKGFYDPDETALQRLAALTQLSPAYFRYGEDTASRRTAPVLGFVGGDAQIHAYGADSSIRPIDIVEAPPGEAAGVVAARVEGDSLDPVYRNGDIIFYQRDPGLPEATFLDHECVVQLADGPLLLRRVIGERQRGFYTLLSHHAPPMSGVRLHWACPVRWVRRA